MNSKNKFLHKFFTMSLAIITSFSLIAGDCVATYAEPDETQSTETSVETSQNNTESSDNSANDISNNNSTVNDSINSQTQTESTKNVAWPGAPEIFGEAGVLIEASTGTVLYDKNCHQQMYPASITKIMTTMLALENGNLSDMVEYYHYDVYSLEIGDASIARQEGELLSLKDTLYAVMLASANECANATGEYVARRTTAFTDKIEELKASGEDYNEELVAISVFADMMNERAKEAGALGTHFSNPNGLFSEDHYTTAYDMAMITRDAIKLDEFLKIEANTSYEIPVTNKNAETQMIYNRHKMLFPSNQNYYEGALGGKTGYVDQSGSTLVTFAKRNGMTLISVVMKSNGANIYNDTRLLLDYGFDNFALTNISENESKFTFNGLGSFSNLNSVFDTDSSLIELSTDGNVVLPKDIKITDCTSKLTFDDEDIVADDSKIAKLNYYYNDVKVGEADLLLHKNDESFKFGPAKETPTTVKQKKDKYININIRWLLGGVFAILAIIAFIYNRIFHANRNSKKRRRRSSYSRSSSNSISYSSSRRRRRR